MELKIQSRYHELRHKEKLSSRKAVDVLVDEFNLRKYEIKEILFKRS